MFSQPSRWLESNSTLKKITYCPRKHFWWSRDGEWDPGWVKSQDTDPRSGSCIRDEQPGSYFLEFRNLIFIHPGSWISGPRSINSNKRVGDKIDITWKNCRTFFCLGRWPIIVQHLVTRHQALRWSAAAGRHARPESSRQEGYIHILDE
jgi:hypothetical protein